MNERRRILRFPERAQPTDAQRQHQLHKLRSRLEREQQLLTRLMARLKRVFHAFEKSQRLVTRLQRQLQKLEDQ